MSGKVLESDWRLSQEISGIRRSAATAGVIEEGLAHSRVFVLGSTEIANRQPAIGNQLTTGPEARAWVSARLGRGAQG